MMGSKIRAIEYALPDKEVDNMQLQEEFPHYDFDKFARKVGIHSRRVVTDETALDLAVLACEKLRTRGCDLNTVDYILYCTQSPEYFLPTTACILQDRLGLSNNVGAFDFNLGCSGFTYGLSMAKAFIQSNQAKNVLLVTAETYSRYIHPKDRTNRSIFGDAAAATLIGHSEDSLIGSFKVGSDGSGYDKLIVKNGACKYPRDESSVEKEFGTSIYSDNHLFMNGPEIFNFTSKEIPRFTQEVLRLNNKTIESVDQFIFHQANSYMLEYLRKRIKIPKEKFYNNMKMIGNTVSSTIPIALKQYSSSINKSEDIVVIGFGVGLSWSGGLITINTNL